MTIHFRKAKEFWCLTKPRVLVLIVFCALVGMLLSSRTFPAFSVLCPSVLGIWLISASSAGFNCIFERAIDDKMRRTQKRPLVTATLSVGDAVLFSLFLGFSGIFVLYYFVNFLTMWLTVLTFVGYSVIYTLLLKPNTPQNIVIGGLSGAMPPVLGWAAVTNELSAAPWVLCLIIYLWTPPHFWALALYRQDDYRKANLPMLPCTHGVEFTCISIVLYTVLLVLSSLLPFVIHLSGFFYLIGVLLIGLIYIYKSIYLWRDYSDAYAKHLFLYSVYYLFILFFLLMLDHYL